MMKTRCMVLFMVMLLALPVLPQQPGEKSYKDISKIPVGRLGERIKSVLDTLNSNNPKRFQSLIENECTEKFKNMVPMKRHLDVLGNIYRRTGGLDFHSIRTYVPERKNQAVIIFKDRIFKSWQAIVLRFADSRDYKISGLQISPARTPSDVKEKSWTEEGVIQEVKRLVDKLTAKGLFSGTVLLSKKDKILFTAARGEASKRFHVPNRVDTKFNLGSMNKMFTSVAIMKLVEGGKLSLRDPLSKFLDESWLPGSMTGKITIHHLLTHTSGLGSYFNDTYSKTSRMQFRKLDDYKPLVKGETLAFEPGKKFRYSNTGMFLLGVVIEKVTGKDYFSFIRKTIYEPAGMKNSHCYDMDFPVENLAIGYSPDPENPTGWQNNYYKHVIKGGPAGGGFSTVIDLHKFALTLLKGKYISQKSLETMWTDHSGAGYGYGFGIDRGAGGLVVGHSGGFSGINSNLDIFVDTGYIAAVMSNIDRGASPLANRIAQLLRRIKSP